MKLSLKLLGVAMAMMPASAFASTTIVNINAAVSGCSPCSGNNPGPGTMLDVLANPTLVDFSAGTYTVTNGVGLAGATPGYDAWRFNASEQNWIWAAIIVDAASARLSPPWPLTNAAKPAPAATSIAKPTFGRARSAIQPNDPRRIDRSAP